MMYLNTYQSSRKENIFANALSEYDCEPVVETTFEWLINPETPVAVQTNCINILFSFKSHYNWIGDELKFQVEFLLRNGGLQYKAAVKNCKKAVKYASLYSDDPH